MNSSRFIQWNIKYSGSKVQFLWFIWLPTRRAELKMDKGLVKHWCAAAPITFAQAQHSHSLRLASHCGVMRGVMCEGGVGEKGTEGLRESWGERERDAEVVEGAVFGKRAITVKRLFFYLFFWLLSSDWRMSTTQTLCNSGTIHSTKTNPHYRQRGFQQDLFH